MVAHVSVESRWHIAWRCSRVLLVGLGLLKHRFGVTGKAYCTFVRRVLEKLLECVSSHANGVGFLSEFLIPSLIVQAREEPSTLHYIVTSVNPRLRQIGRGASRSL